MLLRMRIAAGLAALVLGAAPALAGPFAEVGDRQLRSDVELLSAAGLIEGPVESWPLPWAQIDEGLNRANDGRELPPHLAAAAARLDRLSDLAAQRRVVDIRIGGTNEAAVGRDFGTLNRARFDGSARVEFNTGDLSLSLGGGYRTGVVDGTNNSYAHLEGSQVAVRLGNWAFYGGYTEQWFGPGQDGALMWSNSARPMPKVGFKRLVPRRINFPVLRWLGPVQFEIFGGVLDEDREFDNIGIIGTRLSFQPARGLTIGLNRAQMLCGRGRPCGLTQIAGSFVGVLVSDNANPDDPDSFNNQSGNQLAGWDITYVQRFGRVAAKFYFEGAAEDFDNIVLEQYTRLIGTTWLGPWGSRGASWKASVEYADTLAVSLFNGTPLEGITGGQTRYPGAAYNNSLYTDGYTYRRRPIGYWTDGDSRNLSFAFALTDTRNRRWYAQVRSVHLNITDLGNPPRAIFPRPNGDPGPVISYRVSRNSEKFAILTAGAELPLKFGDVRVEGRFQTDSPNSPGRRDSQAAIEVQFRQRF